MVILLILWSVAFSLFAMNIADVMKSLLFDEGDIHVDPPAMGIVLSTGLALGIFPNIGVYDLSIALQFLVIGVMALGSIGVNLRFFRGE